MQIQTTCRQHYDRVCPHHVTPCCRNENHAFCYESVGVISFLSCEKKKRLVGHAAHIAVSVPKSAPLSFVKTWREKIFALARKFFISRTKTEKISRVFSRIYEPQSEHFRRVNLPRIALSRFVGCLISHFDVPASGKSCRICLF